MRREERGAGVGTALLGGAVDWAAQHGASVLDGHPVDTRGGSASPSAVFTGTLAMFQAAGFVEIGRTYRTRPVMRRTLPGPPGPPDGRHRPTTVITRRIRESWERSMSALDGGLAIIGGGKIGEALLSGLLRRGGGGDVVVCERSPERAAELAARHGVDAVDLAGAAGRARVLLVAVKPQDIGALLGSLAPHVDPARHLVVSVAAGIPTRRIEEALPAGTPVVRVMPNTPALVDEGMSVLSPGAHAGEEHLDQAEALLSAVGRVRRVPESQQDAVTALSGSGPAYFFFLVEAMVDAGILLGLPRTLAADLIVQTALGAAVMLRDSGEHPVQLREAVTSPGGTTIAAIRELERHGVRAALIAAIEAAHDRSVELGGS